MKIPVAKPYIGYFEKKFAKEAINEGWISSNGKYIEKFDRSLTFFINIFKAFFLSYNSWCFTFPPSSFTPGSAKNPA